MDWNTKHINLENLERLARGDNQVIIKYLSQFKELIPTRIEDLAQALAEDNREQIRKILHKMKPQLQFFGLSELEDPLRRIELDEAMTLSDLKLLVDDLIAKLNNALNEAVMILDQL